MQYFSLICITAYPIKSCSKASMTHSAADGRFHFCYFVKLTDMPLNLILLLFHYYGSYIYFLILLSTSTIGSVIVYYTLKEFITNANS